MDIFKIHQSESLSTAKLLFNVIYVIRIMHNTVVYNNQKKGSVHQQMDKQSTVQVENWNTLLNVA